MAYRYPIWLLHAWKRNNRKMRAMKRVREFLERERKKDCKTEIRHKRAKEKERFLQALNHWTGGKTFQKPASSLASLYSANQMPPHKESDTCEDTVILVCELGSDSDHTNEQRQLFPTREPSWRRQIFYTQNPKVLTWRAHMIAKGSVHEPDTVPHNEVIYTSQVMEVFWMWFSEGFM